MRLGVAVAFLVAVPAANGRRLRRPTLVMTRESRDSRFWRQKLEVAAASEDEAWEMSEMMWTLDMSMSMTAGPAPTRAPVAPDTPVPVAPPPTVAPVAGAPTPEPTPATPVADPTPAPVTMGPVVEPTSQPVAAPVPDPTPVPSALSPTSVPVAPTTPAPTTATPIADPTAAPVTATPIADPTAAPVTAVPVAGPTPAPTTTAPLSDPTEAPVTATPAADPTEAPSTGAPETEPSVTPSTDPSVAPSSAAPDTEPSVTPSTDPSVAPSSAAPDTEPSVAPSSAAPDTEPSVAPSLAAPDTEPSVAPSSAAPDTEPSVAPTSSFSPSSTSTPTGTLTTLAPTTMTLAPTATAAPSAEVAFETLAPSETPTTSSPTMTPVDREEVVRERCGVTSLERSRDILSVLSVVSDPVNLITFSTPEFRARNWIDQRDDAVICANNARRIDQRYRLALLYFQLGGPSWSNCRAEADSNSRDACTIGDTRNSRRIAELVDQGDVDFIVNHDQRILQSGEQAIRWLDSANECFWFGLDCGDAVGEAPTGGRDDAFYPLINIDLSENNLEGSLVSEFFGFSSLQGLFLDGNQRISGTIPEELGALSNLRFLDIDDSELAGPLPESLFDLVNLMAIDLNSNQLTGTLSEKVGQLTNLEVLQLQNNQFVGPLPSEALLSLTRLVTFAIEGNLFTGTLEPLCDVRDERRQENELYLQFLFAECAGDDPLVECSCCVCN